MMYADVTWQLAADRRQRVRDLFGRNTVPLTARRVRSEDALPAGTRFSDVVRKERTHIQ